MKEDKVWESNIHIDGEIIEAITALFNFTPELIEIYRREVLKAMSGEKSKKILNEICDLAIKYKLTRAPQIKKLHRLYKCSF